MSGPVEQFSQGNDDQLSVTDSAESSNSLPETSTYFADWLESIQPQISSEVDSGPANQSLPAPARSSGPAPVPGEFRFEGTLRVDCYVTGQMRSQTGTLVVSETGEVDTDLFVPAAIIDGVVRGNIKATEQVELGSNARVIGNIETPSLAIQPGAVFEGRCHFVPAAEKISQPVQLAAEVPPLAVLRSLAVSTEPLETEAAKALVAAAGR